MAKWISLLTTMACAFRGVAPYQTNGLQNAVGWDSYSLFVQGQRVMIWSGEFHPFRLPSPGLWLDVFQKIKATGYTAVSFYVDWASLEGEKGAFRADGIFALEPFAQAAAQAGLYLIARTGPYINSETTGGGFPGWLQRSPDVLRSDGSDYLAACLNYTVNVAKILAPFQITEGGPIILWQVENEYSFGQLYPDYMKALENTARQNGIVIPTTHNDAYAGGHWISGEGSVDIYGSDGYPFGYGSSCANPDDWPSGALPNSAIDVATHKQQNPDEPFGIMEFQGGNPQGWGGTDPALCGVRFGADWERLFYKNMMANGVSIFNVYMTYGGTNWAGIAFPGSGGLTTYDQYSIVAEDRSVSREKYSEAKLEASFWQASPSYLTSDANFQPSDVTISTEDLYVSTLADSLSPTKFAIVRHSDYTSLASTNYTLTASTSAGEITIPQLNGATLILNGRDSKVHVLDYAVGSSRLIYSSAEVFSQAPAGNGHVLVLYGGPDETHELALDQSLGKPSVSGAPVLVQETNGMIVVQWQTSSARTVLTFSNGLIVYLVLRNEAYNYWALSAGNDAQVILNAGYLVRNATISGRALYIVGDVIATTTVEILAAPSGVDQLFFNGVNIGDVSGVVTYEPPSYTLPDLTQLSWKYQDSLPEVNNSYDDSNWTTCNKTTTNLNTPLRQPYSQYSGDYGYHTGTLVYRGHFTSNGRETGFRAVPQGGLGFAFSVWLDHTYLGSFAGDGARDWYDQTFPFDPLTSGSSHVLTVVCDNMGYELNDAYNKMETPRGIVEYDLNGADDPKAIDWKITGNFGGERYLDKVRGPLNEGGLYAERQGFHLPGTPTENWQSLSPLQGLSSAGVGMFSATFPLNLPSGYDIPLSFVFGPAVNGQSGVYRVALFVNGYKFGKYVHNLGPQSSFPVPEGILNHHGNNYVALLIWALDPQGCAIDSLALSATAEIQTGYGPVAQVSQPQFSVRNGAY